VPWQFRKRLRLGPGIHLNIGKKSVSLSVGGRYARTSLSTAGHTTQTYSLPGTGLYHRERTRVFGGAIAPQLAGERRSPAESSYATALEAYSQGSFDAAYQGFAAAIKQRVGGVSADFFAGVSLFMSGRVPQAIPHLERVVESDQELPDRLLNTYAPPDQVSLRFEIALVQGIYASLEVDSLAAALLLAEAYQGTGKRDQAIALMDELLDLMPDDVAVRLSLCDLLFEAADFHRTIDVSSEASPISNLGFACWIFKAQAESWLGDWEAARQTFETALSETEADDEHALRVARDGLERSYAKLGLSSKRLATFQRALARKKRPTRTASRSTHTAIHESDAYEPQEET